MNENWTRWFHATLCTYVKAQLTARNVFVFFEGQGREPLGTQQDYVEFRWNGPDAKETSRNYWEIDVILNFVITSATNRPDTFTHKKVVGIVQSILPNNINVFKLGDGVQDDQSLLGCLQLRAGTLLSNYFGRRQEVELEDSTVEATYCMTGNLPRS